ADITPPNNSAFHSSDLKTINITFNRPIYLNLNNISIYQIDDSKKILRQFFKTDSKFITIDMNENTVILIIIDSVFNIPGATYSLEIDENFFRYRTGIEVSVFPNRLSIQYNTGKKKHNL